jgi:Uma2 family endonuclease
MSVLDRGPTTLPGAEPVAPPAPPMTLAEFLALPDDGIHRELIEGRVWEEDMTYRDRFHASVEVQVAYLLESWRRDRPEPRGQVVSGEAGFRLTTGGRDSLVGVDVAYVSPEQLAATAPDERVFDGAPLLAVEVLSGSETHEAIVAKVALYLAAGAVVWVVDPDFRTVTIHRPGLPPEGLNETHTLDGAPELPGFRAAVRDLFQG